LLLESEIAPPAREAPSTERPRLRPHGAGFGVSACGEPSKLAPAAVRGACRFAPHAPNTACAEPCADRLTPFVFDFSTARVDGIVPGQAERAQSAYGHGVRANRRPRESRRDERIGRNAPCNRMSTSSTRLVFSLSLSHKRPFKMGPTRPDILRRCLATDRRSILPHVDGPQLYLPERQ